MRRALCIPASVLPFPLVLLSLLLLSPIVTRTADAAPLSETELSNRRCMNCHGQSHVAGLDAKARGAMVAPATRPSTGAQAGPRPELYVTPDSLAGSVHQGLGCVDCHQDAKSLPHAAALATPSCNSSCHAGANDDFRHGAHADAIARNDPRAPTCVTCHGGHDIRKPTDRASKTFPLNAVKVCGECHAQHAVTANGSNGKEHVDRYMGSVHGQAVSKGGLAVAATCADCHGSHKVLASADPASMVSRGNVAKTCGTCHVGLNETFQASVHGSELAKGNAKAPVCTDCHTGHAITRTDVPAFKLDIVAECGTCHDNPDVGGAKTRVSSLYDTYRRSYHGQVTALGETRAARCSDCHGAHDIQRISAPASRLNDANRLATCQECHPKATAKFAQFEAHADHRDRERYPILHGVWIYFVVMMSFAFGFFGLHSVLWFSRSIIERIKHGPHPHHKMNPHAIQRFNRVDRINHAFVIISFFGLTLTGLPLLYADKAWAVGVINAFGGVGPAGVAHRIFAVILIGNFVVHGFGILNRIRKHGLKNLLFGPTTMLPRWKDVTDCVGMFRWFFVGGRKPKFDRWTYWEKFDYVAEVGGSGIIAVSGLMLWFPEFFSRFLPGWMFNVATIVHGYEALLAIGFIFTIHFFNAHLRLEKFPVDDVMFTGRLSEEEFKEERGVEYERLVASGEIEKLRVAPPVWWYRYFAVIVGMLAMAIGTTLVVLIVLAGLNLI